MHLLADTQACSSHSLAFAPRDCTVASGLSRLLFAHSFTFHSNLDQVSLYETKDYSQNQRSKSVGSSLPESYTSLRQFVKTSQMEGRHSLNISLSNLVFFFSKYIAY